MYSSGPLERVVQGVSFGGPEECLTFIFVMNIFSSGKCHSMV